MSLESSSQIRASAEKLLEEKGEKMSRGLDCLLDVFERLDKKVKERCVNLFLNEITGAARKYGYDLDDPTDWPADIEVTRRKTHHQVKIDIPESLKAAVVMLHEQLDRFRR